MNIEEVREYALSLNEQVTENLFVKSWISWRIAKIGYIPIRRIVII